MSHLGAVAGAAAQPAHPPLPVASTGNVSADMDELQRVEARLLAERQECERIEAQIRALTGGVNIVPPAPAFQAHTYPAPAASTPAPAPAPAPAPGSTLSSDVSLLGGQSLLEALGAALAASTAQAATAQAATPPPPARSAVAHSAQRAQSTPSQDARALESMRSPPAYTYGMPQGSTPARGRTGRSPARSAAHPPHSPRSVFTSATVATGATGGDFGAGTVRSVATVGTVATHGHSSQRSVSPARQAGVTFRSPMYRNASPSRRVGADKVLISNFGRSPRFVEEKGWVPGPGTYAPPASVFSPVTVPLTQDVQGTLGHTWSVFKERTDGAASASVEHEAAILAATARIKVQPSAASRSHSPSDAHAFGDEASASAALHGARAQRERVAGGDAAAAAAAASTSSTAHLRAALDVAQTRLARLQGAQNKVASRTAEVHTSAEEALRQFNALAAAVDELSSSLLQSDAGPSDATSGVTQQERAQRALRRHPALSHVIDHTRRVQRALSELASRAGDAAEVAASRSGEAADAVTSSSAPSSPSAPPPPRSPSPTRGADEPDAGRLRARRGSTTGGLPKGIAAADLESFSRRTAAMTVSAEAAALKNTLRMQAEAKGFDTGRFISTVEQVERAAQEEILSRAAGSGTGSGARSSPPSPAGTPTAKPASSSASVRRGSVSSSASPQRRAPGAHALSPVLRRKSLISADALAGGGGGTPTSPSSAPSTVAQTLQQLFKYYSLFGDRESDGTSLRSSQFAKMMKDAGLLSAAAGDGSNVTAADVDVAFSRYVAMGTRMRFDAFISACNELAALYAHGREGGAIGIATSGETDATTLRSFIMDILVPLHASVQSEPLFIMDVLQVGADDYVARFADEFARPDVLGFLSDHRSSLLSIFNRYAFVKNRDGSVTPAQSRSSTASGATRMSRKGLVQFALDFKLVPTLLSRPELTALTRDALRAMGRSDGNEELQYAEWLELLGLMAYTLTDERLTSGTGSALLALGLTSTRNLSMLTKIQLLFFTLHDLGARFDTDSARLLRSITLALRAEAQAAAQEVERAAAASKSASTSRVNDIMRQVL